MRYTYEILQDGEAAGYGIGVFVHHGDVTETVRTVRDCTGDKNKLEQLVSACNRLQPSNAHLDDIIEDFLG